MELKHWAWLTAGLLIWAALLALWVTGPHDCSLPDRHGKVHCR